MLSIRLLRTGKKNQPFYRMVVTDKKNPPRGGRFLEIVGFLNPFSKEKQIKIDRIKHWISVGAKPSDTVHNILVKEKVVEDVKIALHKKPKKKAIEAKVKAEAEKNKPAPAVEKEKPTKEASAGTPSEVSVEPEAKVASAPDVENAEPEKTE